MSFIDLDSVGSTLTDKLVVFPQLVNELPETSAEADEVSGVHLYDVDSEWFNSLSSDDLVLFFDFIEETQDDLEMITYNSWKNNIWSTWENVNNCYMELS